MTPAGLANSAAPLNYETSRPFCLWAHDLSAGLHFCHLSPVRIVECRPPPI